MASLFKKLEHFVGGWLENRQWQIITPQWTLPSGIPVTVKNKAEWVIYNDIFVDGEYDNAIQHVIDSGVENPLVIDLGANVGYFGARFADLWIRQKGADKPFRMVGVEGAPDVYGELDERMKDASEACNLNGALKYHFGLVGEKEGEAFISTSHFHVTNSIAGPKSRFGEMVPFIDLEKYLPENDPITLMKCDVEGAEEAFINNYGPLLGRVQRAIIELHHDRCDIDACIAKLNEAGLTKHTRIRDCLPEFTVDLFERG